jgi:hypothetical protein
MGDDRAPGRELLVERPYTDEMLNERGQRGVCLPQIGEEPFAADLPPPVQATVDVEEFRQPKAHREEGRRWIRVERAGDFVIGVLDQKAEQLVIVWRGQRRGHLARLVA